MACGPGSTTPTARIATSTWNRAQRRELKQRQLLWIDVVGREPATSRPWPRPTGIQDELTHRLASETGRADLTQYADYIHLILESMDLRARVGRRVGRAGAARDRPGGRPQLGRHGSLEPVPALDRIDELTPGETRFGALDAAGFLAAIVDEILAGYLALAETHRARDRPARRAALRWPAARRHPRPDRASSAAEIGAIRRTLTPHRVAFAALARPEMELHEELGRPWPGLTDHLDRAIDAVENLRDLLLGTYDIHMGRSAQHANEMMKRLTLLSAVLLPAVVLAGIMGMNYQKLDFFEDTGQLLAGRRGHGRVRRVGLLAVARWRGWL